MALKAIAVMLVLAMLAGAQASTNAADTTDYLWPVDFEDPVSDQTGPTPGLGVTTPNNANPESDIRRVQMTDDGTTFIIKITMGTCKFAVPSGFAMVIFELTAGGKDLEMTAKYKDGCTSVEPFESDSVLGDADAKIAGLRAEAVPSENAIYLMSDFAANGLVAGDILAFDRIHSGRQFTDPGRYTFGLDEASTTSFTVGSGAALMVPPAPTVQTIYEELADGLAFTFANATNDIYTFNATNVALNVTFVVASGSANVTWNASSTTYAQNMTFLLPAGNALNVSFEAFVGELRFALPMAAAPEAGTPADGGAAAPGAAPTTDDGEADEPALDAPVDGKESPAAPLALVLVGLAMLAARRR